MADPSVVDARVPFDCGECQNPRGCSQMGACERRVTDHAAAAASFVAREPSVVDALNTLRARIEHGYIDPGPLYSEAIAALAVVETALADRNDDELFVLATTYQRMSARAVAAETERDTLREGIAEALTSLATGPAKDGYAYSILSAVLAGEEPT